jgi:hypothetical protein
VALIGGNTRSLVHLVRAVFKSKAVTGQVVTQWRWGERNFRAQRVPRAGARRWMHMEVERCTPPGVILSGQEVSVRGRGRNGGGLYLS